MVLSTLQNDCISRAHGYPAPFSIEMIPALNKDIVGFHFFYKILFNGIDIEQHKIGIAGNKFKW